MIISDNYFTATYVWHIYVTFMCYLHKKQIKICSYGNHFRLQSRGKDYYAAQLH